jgi:hypothetical protein
MEEIFVRCAICNELIEVHSDRWLHTTDGDAVHLICSEGEAQQMWQRQKYWAIGHLLVMGIISLALFIRGTALSWLPWLLLAWLALHRVFHRRWWYYSERDLRVWWHKDN